MRYFRFQLKVAHRVNRGPKLVTGQATYGSSPILSTENQKILSMISETTLTFR